MRGKSRRTQDDEATRDTGPGGAAEVLSVLSSDMHIRGECETRGQLRIEGTVSGDITAGGVELAPSGTVEGDVIAKGEPGQGTAFIIGGSVSGAVRASRVEVRRGGSVKGGVVADEAVILGRVQGGVQARKRLALEESAEVEGDVLARRLSLKEGGRVNGNIRMGDDIRIDDAPASSPAARKESKASKESTKPSGDETATEDAGASTPKASVRT